MSPDAVMIVSIVTGVSAFYAEPFGSLLYSGACSSLLLSQVSAFLNVVFVFVSTMVSAAP